MKINFRLMLEEFQALIEIQNQHPSIGDRIYHMMKWKWYKIIVVRPWNTGGMLKLKMQLTKGILIRLLILNLLDFGIMLIIKIY